jgi:glutamate formiminotransferase
MNLTDFEQTSPAEAFEAVRREASPLGVTVAGGEIIGLVPQKALAGATPEFLQLVDFRPREVLENRLAEVLGDPQQGGKADPPLRSG